MLLYPTFIPNQNNYNMLGIKLGIKNKKLQIFLFGGKLQVEIEQKYNQETLSIV